MLSFPKYENHASQIFILSSGLDFRVRVSNRCVVLVGLVCGICQFALAVDAAKAASADDVETNQSDA